MGPLGLSLAIGAPSAQGKLAGSPQSLAALLFPGAEPGALFDLSDASTVFQDRSATPVTPAGADDPVGTILDLSGNANHLIAPNDAARGVLRQSGGLAWLELDGVDDGYAFSAGLPHGQDLDLFFGLETDDGSFVLIDHGGYGSPTSPVLFRIENAKTGTTFASAGAPNVLVDGVSVADDRDTVSDALRTGASHVLTGAGVNMASGNGPTLTGGGTWRHMTGNLYVIAIAPSVSVGVRAQVEALIAAKSGAAV